MHGGGKERDGDSSGMQGAAKNSRPGKNVKSVGPEIPPRSAGRASCAPVTACLWAVAGRGFPSPE